MTLGALASAVNYEYLSGALQSFDYSENMVRKIFENNLVINSVIVLSKLILPSLFCEFEAGFPKRATPGGGKYEAA